jgi:hypothetical protein
MSEEMSINVEETVEPSSESVFRYLGYGSSLPSAPVLRKLRELGPKVPALVQSMTLCRICSVNEVTDLCSKALPAPIQGASFLAFGLVTVGAAIEQEAKRLRETGRLLDSVILNALGSATVSELCEQMAYRVFGWAEEHGLNASRAFEPGSGASRWPLENQHLIFANLRAERIGVELTSHLLMRPHNTLSFLMGIGTEIEQASAPFSCQGCQRTDCQYRYEPEWKLAIGTLRGETQRLRRRRFTVSRR